MTITQIEYFIAVCKYQNFSKAAEELHISQPGISKAMRELEEECGVALFERNYNNIVITKEGEILLESAQKFLEHFQELDRTAHSLACGKAILKIGVVPMCGNTVFPRLHSDFLEAFPDIRIETIEDTASVLYDLLDQHEIDFALCVTNHLPEAHYKYYILKKSHLELFVPKTALGPGKKLLTLANWQMSRWFSFLIILARQNISVVCSASTGYIPLCSIRPTKYLPFLNISALMWQQVFFQRNLPQRSRILFPFWSTNFRQPI